MVYPFHIWQEACYLLVHKQWRPKPLGHEMRRASSPQICPSSPPPPREVSTSFTLPTLSPLTDDEGLLHVPTFATFICGHAKVAGTLFLTNHRLLWEVSDAVLSLDGGAEGLDFFALPIHSLEAIRTIKSGKEPGAGGGVRGGGAGVGDGGGEMRAVEVMLKYAAYPQFRLLILAECTGPLVAALHLATLFPPKKKSDLRADVRRSLAFSQVGTMLELTPGESARQQISPGRGSAAVVMRESISDCSTRSSSDSMHLFRAAAADGADLVAEYRRMGIRTADSSWRICSCNLKFELCSSYPPLLAVPASMSDDQLQRAADFRSHRRLPVLCWKEQSGSAAICRSSQPKVGVSFSRSSYDEMLLQAIVDANPSGERLQIVDCRPRINAELNHATGKGYEHTILTYRMAKVSFAGIENIHVVRAALKSFMVQLRNSSVAARARESRTSESWLPTNESDLDSSTWLDMLRTILKASARVAQMVRVDKSSVLVHCSDGWDRTPQVTALAQLMLDSKYRTCAGFRLLIEKEWLAFGHQFAVRCGTISPLEESSPTDDQLSPIFLQFIDCVWQLTQQQPTAFEFNSRYLMSLMFHVTSCQFGTFLCDSAKQRAALAIASRTTPVWDALTDPGLLNGGYMSTEKLLLPDLGPGRLKPWITYYCRKESFMQAGMAGERRRRRETLRSRGSGKIKVMLRRKQTSHL